MYDMINLRSFKGLALPPRPMHTPAGIASAPIEALTSPGLRELRGLVVPILAYGTVRFTSPSGLNEEYLFSNAETAMLFVGALNAHKAALQAAE